jgi:hypothetical protein
LSQVSIQESIKPKDSFELDVFIPTIKKKLNGLLCNVHTVLNSGLRVRVTISLPDDSYPEFMDKLTEEERSCIRLIKNVPQGNPSIPIQFCMENLDWLEWVYMAADDDCILPWALKHLWEAREGVSMVMGQVIGTSREKHLDFSEWKIGIDIIRCHVNTAMYNFNSLRTLPKPWLEIDPCSDYLMIKRFADNFPYKIIPSVVHVSAFAELENLPEDFVIMFKRMYGHIL